MLQIGRAYDIVRILNRNHGFFMILRISYDSGEVLVRLPRRYAERFSSETVEFMGMTPSNESVLWIRGNGFAMLL